MIDALFVRLKTDSSIVALADPVGREMVSPWLEVTQEAITQFADVTGDRQWIHVDAERARQDSPYRNTIAHGFFTLSLISRLLRDAVGVVEGGHMSINYGLNKVRFPAPLPAGFARARPLHAAEGRADRGRPPGDLGCAGGTRRHRQAVLCRRVAGALLPREPMELLAQQVLNGLVTGSVYSLVALGLTLTYGTVASAELRARPSLHVGRVLVLHVDVVGGVQLLGRDGRLDRDAGARRRGAGAAGVPPAQE